MKILVTGGAGFIGSNLTARFLKEGHDVRILDNLSRKGTPANLAWLKTLPGNLSVISGDIRNYEATMEAVQDVDLICHLAAQVAVTTSVTDPRHDFEVNLLGSFNVIEAARMQKKRPMVIYTSTNKVYGKMDSFQVTDVNGRWEYKDLATGNPESTPLDFYSPYGCSKGGADQYIHDYCRIYGIPSVIFRMSCIYGPRQMGCEDQGWVAFFIIQAIRNRSVTIYGDGKQVRDVLYVDDLVEAFLSAYHNRQITSGKIYNIGGGPEQTLSLIELIDNIQTKLEHKLPFSFDEWRPGDQKVYVSDIRNAYRDFQWKPRIGVEKGLQLLHRWVNENAQLFNHLD